MISPTVLLCPHFEYVVCVCEMTAWCAPPTVVQVAQISCVEEEVSSEKVPKAAFAWPERQRSVEV